jgi:hypothetical protein
MFLESFLYETVLILLYFEYECIVRAFTSILNMTYNCCVCVSVYMYVFMFMCIYIELMTFSVSLVDPWKNKTMILMTVFTQIQG